MIAEQLTGPLCEHGEGPAFSESWAGPRWVDMLVGDVLELDDSGAVSRRHAAPVAAFIRPCRDGGWLIASDRSVGRARSDRLESPILWGPTLWDDQDVRSNDGACAPDGRLYLGTMDCDAVQGKGDLFEIGADGTATPVVSRVTISNGLGFSLDGTSAFYVDSPTRRIDRFDWDEERGLTARRPWVSLPADVAGIPDGLAVDADGGVWVALFGGAAVHRYDERGELDAVVLLPVMQPTAVAFAGGAIGGLVVTTSRHGLGHAAEPEAGALFVVRDSGVLGAPVHPFAG